MLLAPGEELSVDFMQYGSQDILVIKDKHSGYISAKLTKDKSTQRAISAIKAWFYDYGFCNQVWTDGGPTFTSSFSEELGKMGIKHVLTSSYNPQR